MTPDQSNPAMKYMPYIMPVFLLFFFNGLPSALTWYYTVSNLITLCLQFVIQTLYHRSRARSWRSSRRTVLSQKRNPNGRSGWSRCRRPRKMRRKGRKARRIKENSMTIPRRYRRYYPALLRAIGCGQCHGTEECLGANAGIRLLHSPGSRGETGQHKTPSTLYISKGTRAGPR